MAAKQSMQGQHISLNCAYQQVNLINQDNKQVLRCEQGDEKLKQLFKMSRQSVGVQHQALYYQQVDHRIEEVGIMAIKEVRYVTEQQWEKMIQMQQNQQEIWNYLDKIYKAEQRHQMASQIPRNHKGQFASCSNKKKPIKKKGRQKKLTQDNHPQHA